MLSSVGKRAARISLNADETTKALQKGHNDFHIRTDRLDY